MLAIPIDFETSERRNHRLVQKPLISLIFLNLAEHARPDGMPTGRGFSSNPFDFSTELSTGRWVNRKTST
jgi:hypothetical protein